MHDFHPVSCLVQPLSHFFCHHHRTVLAASAAKRNRQITLAFVNIVRQQINQQLGNAGNEFLRLRKRPDVFSHARIASTERPEFRYKMRIRQKAHIENQIGVLGYSLAKSEAHTRNQNTFVVGMFAKPLRDMRPQFVHIELGGIDHDVGQGANLRQRRDARL